ncbi:MAG: DUF4430 domain-containing protein [Clostridiales bacterium]|nr:DUF4430 domain-containing protein [Clostridiales bacterium]
MSKKKIAILSAVVVVLLAVFATVYWNLRPVGAVGEKDIVVEVVLADESSKEFKINTDTEFLRQALDEYELIEGDESQYGFFVKTVDGVTANDANQEWWCITSNGEEIMLGIDSIPLNDGDHFEITLTVGY